MSTKYLNSGENKVAETYAGSDIIVLSSVVQEELTYFSVPPSSSALGSVHRVEVNIAQNDAYCLEKIYLDHDFVNSSGTEAPTFQNVFLTISEIKCLVNNIIFKEYKNQEEIFLAVADYLRQASQIGRAHV